LRTRSILLVAFAILLILVVPIAYQSNISINGSNSKALSSSSSSSNPYSEGLFVYLTSSQSLWKASLSGGTINLGVSLPSSITSFNVSLTHYNTWSSQYEVFTKNGFGYLGSSEPMPNESVLVVSTPSSGDAQTLANLLSQKFALNYVLYSSTSSSFTFVSPMNFATEMHIFFWNFLPHSSGGFANMTTEQAFESQSFAFYDVDYSTSSNSYSISYGAISPTSNSTSFSLYSQLGVSSLKYSSSAASSSMQVHVLGGLIQKSNIAPTNYFSNFSSLVTTTKPSSGNLTVPNLSATLDFAFPTIVAYRQVSPLNPNSGQTISVTVTVKDISSTSAPSVKVSFNDSWYKLLSGATLKSGSSTAATYNMTSGQTNTTVYFVTVPSTTGTSFNIPATSVTYSFSAANHTVTGTTNLNNETLYINEQGNAAVETILNPTTSTVANGQPLSLNIFVKNYGGGGASGISVAGHAPFNLGPASSQNFTITAGATTLNQVNSTILYGLTWTDTAGSHLENTNSLSAISSLGNPGSPSTTLSKSISLSASKSNANVSLTLSNGGSTALTNLTIVDPLPSGTTFLGSTNKSVTFANGFVSISVPTVNATSSLRYSYNVTIANPEQNYVLLPANVSVDWNGVSIVHYSQGSGLALGVSASKSISPSAGFQGTTVLEHLGVLNNGPFSVYDVTFSNASETFLSNVNSSKGYTPILSQGQTVSTTLNVNMTGVPGIYNTTTAAAGFVFAGTNQTASSNILKVTIFQDLFSTFKAIGPKIEENHNINISITISNPSNATVSNVAYSVSLPANLKLVPGSGSLSFLVSSLGAHQNITKTFEVTTGIPFQYTIPGGNLTFQYQSRTLKGVTTPITLNVVDDLLTRYGIPVVVGFLIVIGSLFYVRRLVRKGS
jgi:uncharacterized repeat protein (TIGR01451 family)